MALLTELRLYCSWFQFSPPELLPGEVLEVSFFSRTQIAYFPSPPVVTERDLSPRPGPFARPESSTFYCS